MQYRRRFRPATAWREKSGLVGAQSARWNRTDVTFKSLSMTRTIASVYVLPPHGSTGNLAEAITFIESFDESQPATPFTRYEVGVRYSNGDEIRGQFQDKTSAIIFLRSIR
jgi:hypothetical protein